MGLEEITARQIKNISGVPLAICVSPYVQAASEVIFHRIGEDERKQQKLDTRDSLQLFKELEKLGR